MVFFTAAHSGFNTRVPLGGGATIASALSKEWRRIQPFDFVVLGPGDSPSLSEHYFRMDIPDSLCDLTELSERQYARFCFEFERAATRFILGQTARGPVCIVSNDVSEGPNFKLLAARGIRIITIFHVDVVDYFCKFYLRGARPERVTRWYEALRRSRLNRFLPGVLRLVFEKQRDALMHSHRVIVPSRPMKEVLLRCHPQVREERIRIVPWGGLHETVDEDQVQEEKTRIRQELSLGPRDTVLLTLGRISPEKGIGVLLSALALLEVREQPLVFAVGGRPWSRIGQERLRVLICGDPAYMRGRRCMRALKQGADRLSHAHVDFMGHVTGVRKQAVLRLANLYVHPSIHESYGLTIVEAMQAGLPVLTTDHYSARELVDDGCGAIVPLNHRLAIDLVSFERALSRLIRDPDALRAMGARARERAASMRFADAAGEVAALVCEAAGASPSLATARWSVRL